MYRMFIPASRRWVAQECLSVWMVTRRLIIPASCTAPRGPLDTGDCHGRRCVGAAFLASTERWEKKGWVSMRYPVFSKQSKRVLGKGQESVLRPLAAMDMDLHSLAVDIGYLEKETFLEPQSEGIHREKVRVVMKCSYFRKNSENLLPAQDAGQAFFRLSFEKFEDVPVFFQDIQIEKLDSAIAYFQRARRPFIFIAPMEKIVFQLLFGDLSRFLAVKFDQLAHGSGIHMLSGVASPAELECPDGFRIPLCFDAFCNGFRCDNSLGMLILASFLVHDDTPFIEEN